MDLVVKDLCYASNTNDLIGKKCCAERLKELKLPNHPDWMYVAFTCTCKQTWRVWRDVREITKPS